MSENGVQTSDELNEKGVDESAQEDQLSSGHIPPTEGALEIQAAKDKRFAAEGETVQGTGEEPNFGTYSPEKPEKK